MSKRTLKVGDRVGYCPHSSSYDEDNVGYSGVVVRIMKNDPTAFRMKIDTDGSIHTAYDNGDFIVLKSCGYEDFEEKIEERLG